ncbi:MAG: hypothetical protein QOD93_7486 [Acetobacteraceae bacterium]|jgi:hypothetical protein|nr:hypothetical protein [Acetobacteraceae bacterium]
MTNSLLATPHLLLVDPSVASNRRKNSPRWVPGSPPPNLDGAELCCAPCVKELIPSPGLAIDGDNRLGLRPVRQMTSTYVGSEGLIESEAP